MFKTTISKILGIASLVFLLTTIISVWLFINQIDKANRAEQKAQETALLLASTQDTLKNYKSEDGLNKAKISRLETSELSSFTKLQLKEAQLIWLQDLVKQNQKDIKKPGDGAVVIETITKVDTFYVDRTSEENWEQRNVSKSFKDDWLNLNYFINKDTTGFKLGIVNKYGLILGTDKEGKKFADITNYNPYSTTTTLRTYQISDQNPLQKPKRWGLGVLVGYGYSINHKEFSPTISVGLSRNLLVW